MRSIGVLLEAPSHWKPPWTSRCRPQYSCLDSQIFIGDPIFSSETSDVHWRPQIFIGDPKLFIGGHIILLKAPYFRWRISDVHWRPQDFHWRPSKFYRRPQDKKKIKFWESQMKISESIIKIWGYSMNFLGSAIKIWGSPAKYGVPLKILGSPIKIWVSPMNLCCLHQKKMVSNKNLGVFNENG